MVPWRAGSYDCHSSAGGRQSPSHRLVLDTVVGNVLREGRRTWKVIMEQERLPEEGSSHGDLQDDWCHRQGKEVPGEKLRKGPEQRVHEGGGRAR